MPVGSVQVRLIGPILNGQAPPIINDALQNAIGDLVAEGESKVKIQLYPGHGLVTGHYRRSIHGETTSRGGRIHDSDVIYGPWLEGVSSRNQTTRFKGYAMWRKTTQKLQGMARTILLKYINKALRRLN